MPDQPDRDGSAPLTAADYAQLAEDCFALARATLDEETKRTFFEASLEYIAKAKALDPNIPDLKF